MMDEKQIVGIADMKLARNAGVLITYALGSCVGICLYDPGIKLATLTHIMLPLNMEAGRSNTFKYADTGVNEAVRKMESMGALRSRITAKIAGGAKMFELMHGDMGNIGSRNVESVRHALKRLTIPLRAEYVGGKNARTVMMDAASGQCCIRSYGSADIIF